MSTTILQASHNKESVILRQRNKQDGGKSLYLDIHHNGKRTRETLEMYLLPETSQINKRANRQTLAIAESIRSKRQIELSSARYEVLHEYKLGTYFLDYYRSICRRRFGTDNLTAWGVWKTTLHHLENYCDETTTFEAITSDWIEGFKDYLHGLVIAEETLAKAKGSKLSTCTLNTYFNKLKACINQACAEGIIPVNPLRGVQGIPAGEVKREHLTWDEVVRLDATPCKYPDLKRAFLFSCFTGVRKSDITNLHWSDVQQQDGMTRIVFVQQKTKGVQYLDITENAVHYLGERQRSNMRVFPHFNWNENFSIELHRWIMAANIQKRITFHCARHTFAVLMLSYGVDIYTVSKLLGHKELHTTQIYAKVIDKKKQEAAGLFPDMNANELYNEATVKVVDKSDNKKNLNT